MEISFTDYSNKKLKRIAIKCGFFIYEGKKHTKVKDSQGNLITIIPRGSRLKREIIRSILEAFREAGCKKIR
jgi:hypothetical protein